MTTRVGFELRTILVTCRLSRDFALCSLPGSPGANLATFLFCTSAKDMEKLLSPFPFEGLKVAMNSYFEMVAGPGSSFSTEDSDLTVADIAIWALCRVGTAHCWAAPP